MRKYRIVFWGTYDLSKPRVRLLLKGAQAVGMEVMECHTDVWGEIVDKSQIVSTGDKLRCLFSWICSYPQLIWHYLRLPPHDVVIIGYMGQLDVLVIWPFARLRRVPIIWDAFISLYDTVVNDRRLVSRRSPLAWILYVWEWLACRAATKIFLDTDAHARFFEKTFRLLHESVGRVFVGAESDIFSASSELQDKDAKKNFTVLFYGQFIPLHGIDIVIEAARILEQSGEIVQWIIVGKGQEEKHIDYKAS
jgi:glycosyltransferase involved in cell wall biosynthesis